MQVATIAYDEFVGRIAIGRILRAQFEETIPSPASILKRGVEPKSLG